MPPARSDMLIKKPAWAADAPMPWRTMMAKIRAVVT